MALPPRFVSYAVRGWLDDLHATLVVSLAETGVFRLEQLWRDAADFRTLATPRSPQPASGHAMAVRLRRDNASEGLVTLHVGPEVADAERVQFALFIDRHLRGAAETVARRRHWLCPHCNAPKGNEEVLMDKLARLGEQAQVECDNCERRFPLYDDLERLFADTPLQRQAERLGELELPRLTARRKGKLLLLEVGARLTSANQKWQEITADEDDDLDLQVEFTDDDGNGTGAYLYLQLKAGPSHLRRRADGRAFPDVRWMEISSVLRRELEAGRSPEQIRQIAFDGEPLDLASVLRWRRKILGGWRG
jgi:hypothetical protein